MAWKEFKWRVLYAKISTSTKFFSAAELILARKMLKITNFRTFSPSFRERFYLSTKITFFLYGSAKILNCSYRVFSNFLTEFAQSKTSTSGQRWKPCLETFSFF
jgi:hypothetical protein